MSIRVLTARSALLFGWPRMAETPAKPLHADRVLVLKKERTLQLLRQGKVIKAYKVALGGDPAGPKADWGITKLRKEPMFSTLATRIASFTSRFTSLIPAHASAQRRARREFSGWRGVRSWFAEWLRAGESGAPGQGLDRWLYRRDQ